MYARDESTKLPPAKKDDADFACEGPPPSAVWPRLIQAQVKEERAEVRKDDPEPKEEDQGINDWFAVRRRGKVVSLAPQVTPKPAKPAAQPAWVTPAPKPTLTETDFPVLPPPVKKAQVKSNRQPLGKWALKRVLFLIVKNVAGIKCFFTIMGKNLAHRALDRKSPQSFCLPNILEEFFHFLPNKFAFFTRKISVFVKKLIFHRWHKIPLPKKRRPCTSYFVAWAMSIRRSVTLQQKNMRSRQRKAPLTPLALL